MKTLATVALGAMLISTSVSGIAQAQSSMGAEARLKERNITLPSEPAPIGNYVNAVQVVNLLFMAGNTSGAQWTPKGKVGGI
jgi:hypothetical protein